MPESDTHVGFARRTFSDAGSTPAASTKIHSLAHGRGSETGVLRALSGSARFESIGPSRLTGQYLSPEC